MKKKILLVIALMPAILFAQNHEEAKKILDQVTSKTKSFKTIQADFIFAMENLQEDIKEEYQGKISIKGDKYNANLMGTNTYFDGKTRWTHMIDAEEVNIDDPDPNDEETLNPASIFTIYKSGYNFAYLGEKTENSITLYSIDLFPINRDKPYSRIRLEINKQNLELHKVIQIGKDGNNYIITINSFKTNTPMEDSSFVFNTTANPGVDVIDMR